MGINNTETINTTEYRSSAEKRTTSGRIGLISAGIEIIRDNIAYFPRVSRLSLAYVKKKNANSDLGWIWAIIKPMMYLIMFYFAITFGFKSQKDVTNTVCPYIIWLGSGMINWFFISDLLSAGPNCYRTHRDLVAKAGYPVSVAPMITVLNNLFFHVCMVGIVLLAAILFGTKPSIYWLQIPVLTLLTVIFTYLWSLIFGMLTSVSADTINFIKSIKPAFFWLSGILFNSRNRSSIVFDVNPITYLVEGYRSAVAYNEWFWVNPVKNHYFAAIIVIMMIAALVLYRRLRYKIPEIVSVK